jgi:hypothetical protein
MAKRRKYAKRGAETATVVSIALGIGTVVAGIAIYEWAKPKLLPPANPVAPTPTGTDVTATFAPPR